MKKNLVGRKVRIISDNENYIDYLNVDLVVKNASSDGPFYDETIYDLETTCGEIIPFSLYDYEFEIID